MKIGMIVVIEDHPDSIESIEREGQIVKVIGKGFLKSPGHPAGNQMNRSQIPFFKALKFLVFNRDLEKKVEYLGEYVILGHQIKLTNEGFRYFLFTMTRAIRSMPGVEPAFPPE